MTVINPPKRLVNQPTDPGPPPDMPTDRRGCVGGHGTGHGPDIRPDIGRTCLQADVDVFTDTAPDTPTLAASNTGDAAVSGGRPDTGPGTSPDTASGVSGRTVLLTPASKIRMRAVRWTWTDRVPAGAITVIPGREGIGKSLTLAWLSAQITRGVLPGCHHGVPRPVIYAASEDSWGHTIAPRLYAAGADLDLVYRVDIVDDGGLGQLTLPRDCTALAAEIDRLGVALLAADPLLSLIHASIDTHRDRDLRTALEPLAKMADATGCAVVGLAHFNKSASPDALNLITGSRAFSAVARAVLAIARDSDADDGSCVLSQAKNNLGRLDLPSLRYIVESAQVPTDEGPAHVGKLVFTGETDRSVADILSDAAAGDTDGRGDKTEATDWLRAYLTEHHGQADRADVLKAAREVGISEASLKRVRARAGVDVDRSGFPARSVWRLNPGHPASPPTAVGSQIAQLAHVSSPELTEPTAAQLGQQGHAQSPTVTTEPGRPLTLVYPTNPEGTAA